MKAEEPVAAISTGTVPKGWHIKRLKWSIGNLKNGVWGNDPVGNIDDIKCIRVADFNRVTMSVIDIPTTRNVSKNERIGRLVLPGDLLLEKSGGGEMQPVGAVAMYRGNEPAICSNFVALISCAADVDAKFFLYVHAALYSARINLRSIKQTSGIQNLDANAYLSEFVAYPPQNVQREISEFLDHYTAEADALVAKYELLIELLEEKRVSVIAEAVTKGIDPKVPMRDSGISWAGQTPEHWITPSFGYVAEIVLGKMRAAEPSSPGDVLVPYLKARNVTSEKLDFHTSDLMWCSQAELIDLNIQEGDIIVCEGGVTFGRSAIASKDGPNAVIFEKSLHRVRTSKMVDPEFLNYALIAMRNSGFLSSIAETATFAHLTREKLVATRFSMPTIQEQRDIVQFIKRKTAEEWKNISRIRLAIALVKERRSALITGAVTGEVDIKTYKPAVDAEVV